MPSIQSPLGALPSRFRQQRILIIGCGDIGTRAVRHLSAHTRVMALTSSGARIAPLRAAGIVPLVGNLDAPMTLRRLAGLGQRVIHLAPPASFGSTDSRTRSLLAALRGRSKLKAFVYLVLMYLFAYSFW